MGHATVWPDPDSRGVYVRRGVRLAPVVRLARRRQNSAGRSADALAVQSNVVYFRHRPVRADRTAPVSFGRQRTDQSPRDGVGDRVVDTATGCAVADTSKSPGRTFDPADPRRPSGATGDTAGTLSRRSP